MFNISAVQQLPKARFFHVSAINCDILWRRNRRLPKNPTSSGTLTDMPDYSFIDGRPAPIGVCSNTFDILE